MFHAVNSEATLVGFHGTRNKVGLVKVQWSDIIFADPNATFDCRIDAVSSYSFDFHLSTDFFARLKECTIEPLACEPSTPRYSIVITMSLELLIKRVPQLGVALARVVHVTDEPDSIHSSECCEGEYESDSIHSSDCVSEDSYE